MKPPFHYHRGVSSIRLERRFNGYDPTIDAYVFPSFRCYVDPYSGRIYVVFDSQPKQELEVDFEFRGKCSTHKGLCRVIRLIDRWLQNEPLLRQLIIRAKQDASTHADRMENSSLKPKSKRHRPKGTRMTDEQRADRSERVAAARRAKRKKRAIAPAN
jgi:hypothetical protein